MNAGERGSVTAELAVALPAVALVLGACAWGLQLASLQVRLQDAAALAARAVARGDAADAAATASPGATFAQWREGDLVCASAQALAPGPAGLPGVALIARSCALDGGR